MLNTYVVEGGVGKCTAFTALLPKLKKKSEVQVYTPYIDCFAGNPDVKLALEQTIPLQDPRIMASDNIFYCENSQIVSTLYCPKQPLHKLQPMVRSVVDSYLY